MLASGESANGADILEAMEVASPKGPASRLEEEGSIKRKIH